MSQVGAHSEKRYCVNSDVSGDSVVIIFQCFVNRLFNSCFVTPTKAHHDQAVVIPPQPHHSTESNHSSSSSIRSLINDGHISTESWTSSEKYWLSLDILFVRFYVYQNEVSLIIRAFNKVTIRINYNIKELQLRKCNQSSFLCDIIVYALTIDWKALQAPLHSRCQIIQARIQIIERFHTL